MRFGEAFLLDPLAGVTGAGSEITDRLITLSGGRLGNSRVSPDQQVSGQEVGSREEGLHLQGPLSFPLPLPVLLPLPHRGLASKHVRMAHHDVQNKILNKTHSEEQRGGGSGSGESGRSVIFPPERALTLTSVSSWPPAADKP